MIRGMKLFYCSKCGKRFMGMDVEWCASILSAPLQCPQCDSWHTRPWSLLPARIADMEYKGVWRMIDEDKAKQ